MRENLKEESIRKVNASEQSVGGAPYVTVVIPTFNDREHIVDAVRSVTFQTLHNVEVIVADDGSTDDTEELIRSTFEDDARVRYLRLSENTGAAGAPRNRGIEAASGEYVLFLDSDDTLERHACKSLFLRARESGADVTGGVTVRHYIESGRQEKWYPHLYEDHDYFDDVDERPLFTHDTLITNKFFRREFLMDFNIRFPEDMHYEDVVFAADVYSRAKGFALIPETVYVWNVYPVDVRQSISNQRNMRRNLSDRIRSIQLARDAYENHSHDVKVQLDQKVMRHHLRLYLNDIEQASPEDSVHILETVRQTAKETSLAVYEDLEMPLRMLYASVLAGNLDAVIECVRALDRGAFPGAILRSDTKAVWTPFGQGSELQLPPEWLWLVDVSSEKILRVPHSQFDYLHTATDVVPLSGGRVRIAGEFRDPLGKVDASRDSAALVFRTILGVELARYELQLVDDGSIISWNIEADAPERRGLSEVDGRTFDIELKLADGARSTRPLFLERPDSVSIADRSLIGKVLGDRWVATSLPHAPSELQIVPSGFLGKAVRKSDGGLARAKQGLQRTVHWVSSIVGPNSSFGQRVAYPLLRRLPIDNKLVFFESHMGLSLSDSPYSVYRSMAESETGLKYVWSVQPKSDLAPLQAGSRTVARKSYSYWVALARAKFVVDNQSLPREFVKRDGQRYLQTWHGIPLKKMGKDEPRFSSAEAQRQLDVASSKWDLLNIPSPYFEETFVPAYGYSGEGIRYGSPRNDALVNQAVQPDVVRRRLDIPEGVKVVLFAPTFRENRKDRRRAADIGFDLSAWAERFGEDTVLLVRSHYLNRFYVPARLKGTVVDVSDYPDVSDLYIVADTLVTDYSSVMFDFAILRKPIIIYAPDYSHYVDRSRGTYFDLRTNCPGAFAETEEELFDALEGASRDSLSPEHDRFVADYCGIEDGTAAARSVVALLEVDK